MPPAVYVRCGDALHPLRVTARGRYAFACKTGACAETMDRLRRMAAWAQFLVGGAHAPGKKAPVVGKLNDYVLARYAVRVGRQTSSGAGLDPLTMPVPDRYLAPARAAVAALAGEGDGFEDGDLGG